MIDYTSVDFAEAVEDVDVVLDAVGGDYAARSLRTLRDGGMLVSIVLGPPPAGLAEAQARGIRAVYTLVDADHAGMKAIADLVEAGRLRAAIDSVFPLEDAAKAHAHGETNRTTGKIVLTAADPGS